MGRRGKGDEPPATAAAAESLESRILSAATTGDILDVSDLADEDRRVDAGFLRNLYLGRHDIDLDPRGPELGGLHVDGDLDLSYADITVPIRTQGCTFHGIHLTHARTRTVWLAGARLDQFHAEGVRIDGPLGMSGARIHNPDLAIHLLRAEIAGSAFLEGLICDGPITATGVRVGGQLTFAGATLVYAGVDDVTLNLNGAQIAASVRLSDGFTCGGPIQAIAARIGGQLSLHASHLSFAGARGLVLDDAEIPGGVFGTGGFFCAGQIHAIDARIGRPLNMIGATLAYTGDDGSLILDSATIDGTVQLADGFSSAGPVRAVNARIYGDLAMRGATLTYSGDDDDALNLRGAEIGGSLVLNDGFTCAGQIDASYARIAGPLTLRGAVLTNTGEHALCLDAADITGGVLLGAGFQCAGRIHAAAARIGRELYMNDANLTYRDDATLDVGGVRIDGNLVLNQGFRCAGPIVVTGASVSGALIDDPAAWPDGSILEGFSYGFPADVGEGHWAGSSRVAWLDRMAYSSQAYRFLADRYRARGMPDSADDVIIAMRRRERERFTGRLVLLRRRLDWLFERVAGYGYRPLHTVGLAAVALAITAGVLMIGPVQDHLVADGTTAGVTYTANRTVIDDRPITRTAPPDPVAEGGTDDRTAVRFQPVFYAIDTVVPLVDLGQRDAWTPDTTTAIGWLLGVFLNVMRLAGWLFAAAITFAVARLFQTRHG